MYAGGGPPLKLFWFCMKKKTLHVIDWYYESYATGSPCILQQVCMMYTCIYASMYVLKHNIYAFS